MKVLAFAGSDSKHSINKQLVTYAAQQLAGAEVEIVDLNDIDAPMYGIDYEQEHGFPNDILSFAEKMSSADLILLSLVEHNGAYSAAFKSLYDWVSRIPGRKIFDNKPLLLMATSPGGRGGAGVLEIATARFPRDSAQLVGVFSLSAFYDNFKEGEIVHAEKKAELLGILSEAIKVVQG